MQGVDDKYPAELIERDLAYDTPRNKLVGDITYLCRGMALMYLATVIDVAARMVVGW